MAGFRTALGVAQSRPQPAQFGGFAVGERRDAVAATERVLTSVTTRARGIVAGLGA